MKEDNLKKIIDGEYENIPVPEGLEECLSAKIDSLAAATSKEPVSPMSDRVRKVAFSPVAKWISIAAAIIIVAGTSFIFLKESEPKYTCATVEEAKIESCKAFQMIAEAMDFGMQKAAESARVINKANTIVEKQIRFISNEND